MNRRSSKWVGGWIALLAMASIPVYGQTPHVLQITRDVLKPGVDADYAKVEDEAVKLCISMHCPNPYLAVETVDDPKEVWIIHGFDTEDQARQALGAYQQNTALLGALKDVATRKAPLLSEPSQSNLASLLVVLSGGPPWWTMAEAHYLIMTHTRGQPGAMGAVYAADDGSTYEIRFAATLDEAKQKYKMGDPNARIFEVRPGWALPDKTWIAANPTFWGNSTPIAR